MSLSNRREIVRKAFLMVWRKHRSRMTQMRNEEAMTSHARWLFAYLLILSGQNLPSSYPDESPRGLSEQKLKKNITVCEVVISLLLWEIIVHFQMIEWKIFQYQLKELYNMILIYSSVQDPFASAFLLQLSWYIRFPLF